jgi:hypothetical protein
MPQRLLALHIDGHLPGVTRLNGDADNTDFLGTSREDAPLIDYGH